MLDSELIARRAKEVRPRSEMTQEDRKKALLLCRGGRSQVGTEYYTDLRRSRYNQAGEVEQKVAMPPSGRKRRPIRTIFSGSSCERRTHHPWPQK